MNATSDLIGRPVLDLSSGQEIGKIHGMLIDLEARAVAAFEIHTGFWKHAAFVRWPDLHNVGPDALTVASKDVLQDRAAVDPDRGLEDRLGGQSIFTVSGERLGTVGGYRFALETGALGGFNLRPVDAPHGLFGGTSPSADVFIPMDQVVTLGEASLIVRDEVRDLLHGATAGAPLEPQ